MLREAVLVHRENACKIQGEVIRLMEGDSLRCAVDIHTLHRAVALRRGIVGGNIPAEGIEHGPAADDAHLGRAAAVPYYARLLGLDGTHEGVGKGVGVDVAVLRVVDGMRLALLGEKFEPYFSRLS